MFAMHNKMWSSRQIRNQIQIRVQDSGPSAKRLRPPPSAERESPETGLDFGYPMRTDRFVCIFLLWHFVCVLNM